MKHLRRHLDMPLETSLGYFYNDIFNRHVAGSALRACFSSLGQCNGCMAAAALKHLI